MAAIEKSGVTLPGLATMKPLSVSLTWRGWDEENKLIKLNDPKLRHMRLRKARAWVTNLHATLR